MKNLLLFIFLSVFSIMAFGQTEVPAEKEDKQVVEEAKPSKPEPVKEKEQVSKQSEPSKEKQEAEEAKSSSKKEQAIQGAEPSKKEQATEEAEPSKEKQVSKEAKPSSNEKQEVQKPVVEAEEKPAAAAAVQESDSVDSEVSVQAGVNYECDGGKSYTLHEPGVNSESHLCELDAGHTETPADWYAFNDSSFCRKKLQEMISHYNCVVKE